MQQETDKLLSCSADGTCRLWNPELKSPLLCTYRAESGELLESCLNTLPSFRIFSNGSVVITISNF